MEVMREEAGRIEERKKASTEKVRRANVRDWYNGSLKKSLIQALPRQINEEGDRLCLVANSEDHMIEIGNLMEKLGRKDEIDVL